MLDAIAMALVLGAGAYLVALGVGLVAHPRAASRFLLGFAASAGVHYLELGVRGVVGWAFIHNAPRMSAPGVFSVFGWVLLVTTSGLLLVPWEWHRRFARKAVPWALEYSGLLALGALAAGVLVLGAAFSGVPSWGRSIGQGKW